jgi:hypothetical protein
MMKSKKTVMKTLKEKLVRSISGGLGNRTYRIVSIGAIAAGLVACLISAGIGMGLILSGVAILAEV